MIVFGSKTKTKPKPFELFSRTETKVKGFI